MLLLLTFAKLVLRGATTTTNIVIIMNSWWAKKDIYKYEDIGNPAAQFCLTLSSNDITYIGLYEVNIFLYRLNWCV